MSKSNMPLTEDHQLAQWAEWIDSGAKTADQVAQEFGLVSKRAVLNRIRRWRDRTGGQGFQRRAHEESPEKARQSPTERTASLQRLLQSLLAAQDAFTDLDDTQPVCTLTLPDTKPVMQVYFADLHIGGKGTDHRLMLGDFAQVRDTPGVFACSIGDHCDNFSPAVLPRAMLDQLVGPDPQWELAEMILRDYLGDKLKVGLGGNHDDFSSAAGLYPCQAMYRRLGVPYLGSGGAGGGRVWLQLGGQTYKQELRHDFRFKSSLNTTNSQRRLAELVMGADVVALGNLHYPDLQYAWRGGSNQVWLRGSTYKVHDKYAEANGFALSYAPAPPDMPGVIFWPDVHKTLPFRNFKDGLPVLKLLRGD